MARVFELLKEIAFDTRLHPKYHEMLLDFVKTRADAIKSQKEFDAFMEKMEKMVNKDKSYK